MYLRDKRVHLRKALQTDAWIADQLGTSWALIKLLDISKGGVSFINQEKMDVGSTHDFRFNLPDSSRLMSFVGRITHCTERLAPSGYRIGVKFSKIDVIDMSMIEWFVDHNASRHT